MQKNNILGGLNMENSKQINETELIERRDLRQQYIDRIDVLNKVKALVMLPDLELMTVVQIADFYEVDTDVIQKVYQRHKAEITEDGVVNLTVKFLIEKQIQLKNRIQKKGRCEIEFSDGTRLIVPNRGIKAFGKRTILRIGMLLRDSEIAKEVRTQLLNTFDNAPNEVKVMDINEELEIQSKIGQAFLSGDIMQIAQAVTEGMAYKNRHISKLEAQYNDLTIINKALTKKSLHWDKRASINKAVRVLANTLNTNAAFVWSELYNELLYGHHINLKKRGKSPYIQHIKEDEWGSVVSVFTSMCESKGVNTAEILKKAKMVNESEKAI